MGRQQDKSGNKPDILQVLMTAQVLRGHKMKDDQLQFVVCSQNGTARVHFRWFWSIHEEWVSWAVSRGRPGTRFLRVQLPILFLCPVRLRSLTCQFLGPQNCIIAWNRVWSHWPQHTLPGWCPHGTLALSVPQQAPMAGGHKAAAVWSPCYRIQSTVTSWDQPLVPAATRKFT